MVEQCNLGLGEMAWSRNTISENDVPGDLGRR